MIYKFAKLEVNKYSKLKFDNKYKRMHERVNTHVGTADLLMDIPIRISIQHCQVIVV